MVSALFSSMQHGVMLVVLLTPFCRALCWGVEYVKQLLPLDTESKCNATGTGIQSLCSDPASLFWYTEEPVLYLQITHLHRKARSRVRECLYVQAYVYGVSRSLGNSAHDVLSASQKPSPIAET